MNVLRRAKGDKKKWHDTVTQLRFKCTPTPTPVDCVARGLQFDELSSCTLVVLSILL